MWLCLLICVTRACFHNSSRQTCLGLVGQLETSSLQQLTGSQFNGKFKMAFTPQVSGSVPYYPSTLHENILFMWLGLFFPLSYLLLGIFCYFILFSPLVWKLYIVLLYFFKGCTRNDNMCSSLRYKSTFCPPVN